VRFDSERARIVTEFYKKNRSIVPTIQRAMATYEVCEKMTVRVEDFEIIVGNCSREFSGATFYPEWNTGSLMWVISSIDNGQWTLLDDGLYHNPPDENQPLSISPEDLEVLREIAGYWTEDNLICATSKAWQPECFEELYNLDVTNYNKRGLPIASLPYGHFVPGHEKILNIGYGAIKKQAQDWINEHKNGLMEEVTPKYLFYRSAVMVADAGSLL